MSSEADKIELRSEEVQEILGKIPSWVTRWGITVVFLVLVGLLVIAGIVKYPDIVEAQITLTSTTPPTPIIAKVAGNIKSLHTQDGDTVKIGDVLLVIENIADENDVLSVSQKINTFLLGNSQETIQFPENPNLGKLQDKYFHFLTSYKDVNFYNKANVSANAIELVQSQISELQNINQSLKVQWITCQDELNLVQTNFSADKKLYDKNIISLRELQEKEAMYFQKLNNCENIHNRIASNQVQIQELKMNVFGISSEDDEAIFNKIAILNESANSLASAIKVWKEQYLISATANGIVTLNNLWSQHQYIQKDEEILSIINLQNQIKTIALIGNKGIGKIVKGQNAIISFPAYNYMEYGYINGTVQNISPIPRDNMYQVEITLKNGLVTTYNKEIVYTQDMQGKAEIITEKRTILNRFFDKLTYIFKDKY